MAPVGRGGGAGRSGGNGNAYLARSRFARPPKSAFASNSKSNQARRRRRTILISIVFYVFSLIFFQSLRMRNVFVFVAAAFRNLGCELG